MLKTLSAALLVLVLTSCLPRPPLKTVADGFAGGSVSMRFVFRSGSDKQSGRLNWHYDEHQARLVVFGPINQVVFELYVSREQTTLVRRRGKLFWQGYFRDLMLALWGLNLSYGRIEDIFFSHRAGTGPDGLSIELTTRDDEVAAVVVRSAEGVLELKVLRHLRRAGVLISRPDLRGYSRRSLEELTGSGELADD